MLFLRYILILCAISAALFPITADARTDSHVTIKEGKLRPGVILSYPGAVRGYDLVNYEFVGKAGQKLTIQLTSRNTFLYFNVVSKKTGVALETEPVAREVTKWSGTLPEEGRYVVQVYLVRAEARRNHKANFKLSLALSTDKKATP